jgi:DNA invertase Pin-like site-specific DNA recombinase
VEGRVVKYGLDDPEVIRVPGTHEAIIPTDLFDRVQAKLADTKGWQVVEIYADEGKTGRDDARPEFQRLLSDVHRKPVPFDKLVVWRGSRIFRNTERRLAFHALFARKGIDIISVVEPELEGSIALLGN